MSISTEEVNAKLGELAAFVTDEEMSGLTSLQSIVFVDNLPLIPKEKLDKLITFLIAKIFSRCGTKASDVTMPFGEDGQSKGFAFVDTHSEREAAKIITQFNGFQMDKSHTLFVCSMQSLSELKDCPEELSVPSLDEWKPYVNFKKIDSADIYHWLKDTRSRDQFMVRYAKTTAIYWHDAILGDPILDHDNPNLRPGDRIWCDMMAEWSPQGKFLVTFHRQGILLWGGPNYDELGRFSHENVAAVSFSPNDRYALTWNGVKEKTGPCIKMWNVMKGTFVRSFVYHNDDPWPLYKWSSDGSYLATRGKDCIAVYESESMKLVGGRSIPLLGVREFLWAPTKPLIVYWQQNNQKPDQICVYSVVTREIIQNASVTSVDNIQFSWHPQGYYLAAIITRYGKNRKNQYHTIQLFDFTKKMIPVDVLEFPTMTTAFDWEPKGSRFSVLVPKNISGNINDICFYQMNESLVEKVKQVNVLADKQANCVFWSPQGHYMVITGFGPYYEGDLDFYNVDDKAILSQQSHYHANGVLWDPSGRFVCSMLTVPLEGEDEEPIRKTLTMGYNIWTLQGSSVFVSTHQSFYEFLWRPRPKDFLSEEQEMDIEKNIQRYVEKYRAEDMKVLSSKKFQEAKIDYEMVIAFREFMAEKRARFEEIRRNKGMPSFDQKYTYREEVIEVVLELSEKEYKHKH